MGGAFEKIEAANAPAIDYTKLPPRPRSPRDFSAYTGVYANSYYGPLVVSASKRLSMKFGPKPRQAIFYIGNDGKASKVVLDFYDSTGLGTFVRE
jgi:hypothetical protein